MNEIRAYCLTFRCESKHVIIFPVVANREKSHVINTIVIEIQANSVFNNRTSVGLFITQNFVGLERSIRLKYSLAFDLINWRAIVISTISRCNDDTRETSLQDKTFLWNSFNLIHFRWIAEVERKRLWVSIWSLSQCDLLLTTLLHDWNLEVPRFWWSKVIK